MFFDVGFGATHFGTCKGIVDIGFTMRLFFAANMAQSRIW
jgi:hypothetical protein